MKYTTRYSKLEKLKYEFDESDIEKALMNLADIQLYKSGEDI